MLESWAWFKVRPESTWEIIVYQVKNARASGDEKNVVQYLLMTKTRRVGERFGCRMPSGTNFEFITKKKAANYLSN